LISQELFLVTVVAFISNRKGHLDLYVKDASASGSEELLYESDVNKFAPDWSPDGQFIVFSLYSSTNSGA